MAAVVGTSDRVWEGYINIKAPDGRAIPVTKARPNPSYSVDLDNPYTGTDRIIPNYETGTETDGLDGTSWREVEGFDYSKYGLVKIGGVWVDAKNAMAVKRAEADLSRRNWCIIL